MEEVCPHLLCLSQFLLSRRLEQEKIELLCVDFRNGGRAHVLQGRGAPEGKRAS